VCYWALVMPKPPRRRTGAEPFGEKEFYLEEFRGRTVLIAVSPTVVTARASLRSLGQTVATLARNDTRVLVWWPQVVPGSERRLLAALGRPSTKARGKVVRHRKKKKVRATSPIVRVRVSDLAMPGGDARLRGALWSRLRQGRLCVLGISGPAAFPRHPTELAAALRIPKVVLVDPRGGLEAPGGRLSFVDENVLDTVLREGQAEWTGIGDRRALLVAVRDALDGGVEQVNLCSPDGIAEELFTYVGSGTLFTEGDYTRVGPLGIDDFAQAERLLERGERAGLLKMRTPEEVAHVLSAGYGVTVCGRHLAGVAGLLTVPYVTERAGEIVGLYTITRFKGEGIGERLVERILAEAESMGLEYVFAVTLDERAQQFFERMGFARVDSGAVPPSKWKGYDERRRERVVTYRRHLTARGVAERAS
jgi:amino-acid N-acetyltransferase